MTTAIFTHHAPFLVDQQLECPSPRCSPTSTVPSTPNCPFNVQARAPWVSSCVASRIVKGRFMRVRTLGELLVVASEPWPLLCEFSPLGSSAQQFTTYTGLRPQHPCSRLKHSRPTVLSRCQHASLPIDSLGVRTKPRHRTFASTVQSWMSRIRTASDCVQPLG